MLLDRTGIVADFIDTYGWAARLSSGEIVRQHPDRSSAALPEDAVSGIAYVPLREGLPGLFCEIDLAAGERFVRYWSWVSTLACDTATRMPPRRIYALGLRRGDEQRVLYWYAEEQKFLLSADRRAAPTYRPSDTFALLGPDVLVSGGAGHSYLGWSRGGFGAFVVNVPGGILIRSRLVS